MNYLKDLKNKGEINKHNKDLTYGINEVKELNGKVIIYKQ